VADELGAGDDGVRWVDLPTLRRWAVSDRVTSLELRLALASLDESGVLR
jgi:hypothetical protein